MTNGDNQERRVVMEVSQVEMREEIIRVQGRMDVLETRMDALESKVDDLSARMDRLEANQLSMMQMIQQQNDRIDRVFYAIIGFGAGIIITLAGGIVALITAT